MRGLSGNEVEFEDLATISDLNTDSENRPWIADGSSECTPLFV